MERLALDVAVDHVLAVEAPVHARRVALGDGQVDDLAKEAVS